MKERIKYRQRWVPGSILAIDLQDGTYSYGQVLDAPQVAFYDYRKTSSDNINIQDILTSKLLFKISVMKYCVTQYWEIIGKSSIDPALNEWDDHFYYDVGAQKLFIRKSDMTEIPATWEQCKHLENHAVWEPEHVEQRLKDHFAGRPCKIVEYLKPEFARNPEIINRPD